MGMTVARRIRSGIGSEGVVIRMDGRVSSRFNAFSTAVASPKRWLGTSF